MFHFITLKFERVQIDVDDNNNNNNNQTSF